MKNSHITTPDSMVIHEEVVLQDTTTGDIMTMVTDTVIENITEEVDQYDKDIPTEFINEHNINPNNETNTNNEQEVVENPATDLVVDTIDDQENQTSEENSVNQTDSPVAPSMSSSSQYTFVSDAPIMIETPKDLDASRNIAQWHSRDDIVRDKFEKHIQKIRYESGILKQRNDMLWYEKKLVEGITLLPNDKDFQKQLADLYFHQGKYKKAQSLLKKILTDMPDDHNALWQVGEIALEEWHTDDAYVYFKQAYTLCDDNPKYCFSLAQWYYDKDDLENALPLMEKMVKLRPKNIDYLVSLSHVQHKIWLRDEAKQSLLRALELDPMNITLKNYLKAL